MNDKAGDSLHVDLAVLHHIPLLGLSLLFLSLPFSFVHTSSFLFSLFRQGRGKGEIRERGSISSIFSVPCFVFPSPLFISLLFLSLLFLLRINPVYLSSSFSLLPSLHRQKNTRKDKNTGKWRPFSFLMLFQWLGKVTWPLSMLQRIPPLALSPRFFPLFPNGKESEFLSFSLFFLWFFISKANEQERRKTRKRGKTKTSTILSLPRAKPEP